MTYHLAVASITSLHTLCTSSYCGGSRESSLIPKPASESFCWQLKGSELLAIWKDPGDLRNFSLSILSGTAESHQCDSKPHGCLQN